jgi:UMF1 family MFS transporter
VVTTFIVSNYFAKAIALDPTVGSAQWSYMIAIAGLAVAVASPLLGALADRAGHAKRALGVAAGLTAAAALLLWFARPEAGLAMPVLLVAGAGMVAFELAILFYNALLPGVASAARLGRISGWGWAMGYAGGLACLATALLFLVEPARPIFGIPRAAAANIRACGPLVALWIAVFAWPLFVLVPDTVRRAAPGRAVREGLAELRNGVRLLGADANLLRFLIASALYRDGIGTILAVGGLYAGVTFGLGFEQLILFGIGINVTAGIGAAAFAWLDDRLGSKPTILAALAGLIAFGGGIVAIQGKGWFFAMALALGLFVGPAQSASRSLVVRLAPPARVAQLFGLYALSGRITAFLGPALFGWVTQSLHSQRAGLGVILLFLVAGFALLRGVREPAAAAS